MSTDPLSDARIVDSWLKNAASWTSAVRENQIKSRRLVTNQAFTAEKTRGSGGRKKTQQRKTQKQ